MNRSLKVKQRDITDCGAACLASVSIFYGLQLAVSKIRQIASTDQKGTNVLGLIMAAEKLGFTAKGVKGTKESLFQIPKPSIAHIIVKETLHHYVVIYKVTNKKITVMNPGMGNFETYAIDEFIKIWTGVLLILVPNKIFKKSNEKISIYKRFIYLLRPHKTVLFEAVFGAMLYTILGLTLSIYIQKVIDNVLIEGNRNLLNLLSIGMIVILFVQLIINITKSIFVLKTGQKIDAQLIMGYYKHLFTLPQQFFDTMRVGEIISRINDAVKIRVFINDVLINLIVNIFIILFSYVLMFAYNSKLATISLVIIPIYVLIYIITNQLNKNTQRIVMENSAELENQLIESINLSHTIKKFGLEKITNFNTEIKFIPLLKSVFLSTNISIYSSSLLDFTTKIFTVIVVWIGANYVLDRNITAGELLSFYTLMGYLATPIISIIGTNKTMQDALIAADRLFEIIDLDIEDNKNKISLTKEDIGDINFRNVSFSYGSRTTVFNNLSLNIKKGEITAIIGESGCGKSTIASLLQNIYPIQEGNIKIGNFEINSINNDSLRNLVSIVPQKIELFATSIIENIAVGDFHPNIKKIIEICISLGLHDFIQTLPNNYQTLISENSVNFSGGQQQKIAIARAIYKNPEILILDESTSALDIESEQYIINVIKKLNNDKKTIIIIAHRLSTIQNADKIIVLDKGEVKESGTHNELLAIENGFYKKLYKV